MNPIRQSTPRHGPFALISLLPLTLACAGEPEAAWHDAESIGEVTQGVGLYTELGPLQVLGNELTARLSQPSSSFDIALFSDCHLNGPEEKWHEQREDQLRDTLDRAESGGAKLVWGLGDYGPVKSTEFLTYNHQVFNQILDDVLGLTAARSPEIALMTGNHEWYRGIGKALTLQTAYNFPLNLQGNSNDRYLYYSFVAGDPNSAAAVGIISLDAGTQAAGGNGWILPESLQAEQIHWMHEESVKFRKMGLPIVYGLHEPPMQEGSRPSNPGSPLHPVLNGGSANNGNGIGVFQTMLQFDNAWGSVHGHMANESRFSVGDGKFRPPFEVNVVNMSGRGLRVEPTGVSLVDFGSAGVSPVTSTPTNYPSWGQYPTGVSVFGHATVSSDSRSLPLLQTASGRTQAGTTITLGCDNVPPNATGWVAFHSQPDTAGTYWGKLATWIGMDSGTVWIPTRSDGTGQVSLDLDLPTNLQPGPLGYFQWFFVDPSTAELIASNALEISTQ